VLAYVCVHGHAFIRKQVCVCVCVCVCERERERERLCSILILSALTSTLFLQQVLDYFQDFDPLRSGTISKSRFRRCLSTLGLSKLAQHDLNDKQFDLLCKVYQDPKKEDQVLYTRFVADVESGQYI